MSVLNSQKIRGVLDGIPEVPEKYTTKRRRPRKLAVIIEPSCTGCEVCIPFCPVACIERDNPAAYPDRTIPPVRVRYDECIGCEICARVCEKLAWDAIVMKPTEEVERTTGMVIHERFPTPTASGV